MKTSNYGVARKKVNELREEERQFFAEKQKQGQPLFSSVEEWEEHFRTTDTADAAEAAKWRDSFQNFALNLGLGTDNALSQSQYALNPLSRNRVELEWMHRGSWLAGQAIDIVGDDMTREGVEITSQIEQSQRDRFHSAEVALGIWPAINDCVRWARLYGGCIAVMLIDGQDTATPLKIESVGKKQFKGLLVLDRWMCEPSLGDLIGSRPNELGPHMGMPRYYRVTSFAPGLRGKKIHHSRCLRLEGIRLPYTQRMMENLWGISVLERLYDRMIAFDSATMGAAQLVYKSYIRTYKIKDFRVSVAGNPQVFQQILTYVNMMRRFQGIEGITVLDAEDDFVPMQSSAFSGISDALMQFGQQLAGALQIPLVRLFGMSPAGFSSSGESDLRTYYDGIAQRQDKDLLVPLDRIFRIMARSEVIELGDDFAFEFRPLWKLTEEARAGVSSQVTSTIDQALTSGLINNRGTALKELKRSSRLTGIWTTITDEDIKEAEDEPPPGPPGGMPGMEGAGGAGEGGMPIPGQGPPPEEETTGESGAPPSLPPDHQASVHPFDRDQSTLSEHPHDKAEGHIHLRETGGHQHFYVKDSQGIVPGLDLYVENPKGSSRFPWSTQLPAHYGFIRNTTGSDAEGVDVFVGPEPDAGHDVWIVDQIFPDSGKFDELKVLVAFPNRLTALRAYQRSFDDGSGAARIGDVTRMSLRDLADFLKKGGGKAPLNKGL